MATKVFISFRFSDGKELKDELIELFDSSTEVINRSEDVDRSEMSEDTIQEYLYEKLKNTSVTIVILTPEAVDYRKNLWGEYDDWLYDELRYSLEDRISNRTNGVIALYTDDSESLILKSSSHTCNKCNETSTCRTLTNFDNLARKNMLNVKEKYKANKCDNLYDDDKDSYISLVHFDDFKKDYEKYINSAKEKRDRKEEFILVKRM
ncbi:TIR domain-containing protein (plasmid) [Enterococcus faecalis]|uniref:TIR domain-containing protein n=1 Tax=Enterococcus faecalis TaxID=1351 RepID=UPI001E394927|nr:TIR domain-containing protein [Enterococcus faecalis]MCI1174088.1 TIR domain-containing protein [Enterococcus faecalis]MCT6646690.1 TIR domain-containing protein [Enterococcus faecalis]MDJ9040202.1 TIR domain-containing protein [Enterococcus faecalis]UER81712.1 TIR domain-containing protein [Enterococcus faecalis]